MKGLALVGFMGAGKTTVGQRTAVRLGWPFADLDALLELRFGPIAAQIADEGLERFRAREAALLRELCDGGVRVLATGGGTFVDPASRASLLAAYRTVWLDAPLDVLERRIGPDDPRRPMWSASSSPGGLPPPSRAARYGERRAAYAEAHLRIDTAGRTADEVVDEVIAWLR